MADNNKEEFTTPTTGRLHMRKIIATTLKEKYPDLTPDLEDKILRQVFQGILGKSSTQENDALACGELLGLFPAKTTQKKNRRRNYWPDHQL